MRRWEEYYEDAFYDPYDDEDEDEEDWDAPPKSKPEVRFCHCVPSATWECRRVEEMWESS